ncbi:hypothetical protein J7L48_08950 [bacterium]|nr:hypothetical protein [bacterium]
MKILMFKFMEYFYSKAGEKEKKYENGILVFTHVESRDEEFLDKSTTKYIKNIKWFAGKFNKPKIILHSFAHLSKDKAYPKIAKILFDNAEDRLKNSGFDVEQTPFGFVLNFSLKMDDTPLARYFKEF